MDSGVVYLTIEDVRTSTNTRKVSTNRIWTNLLHRSTSFLKWKRRNQFLSILLLVFISYSVGPKSKTQFQIETTWEAILKNMDTSVAPCEDFYKFACGRFNYVGHGIIQIGNRDSLDILQKIRVSQLLGEPEDSDEFLGSRQAKRLFASCVSYRKMQIGINGIHEVKEWTTQYICASDVESVMSTTIAEMYARRYPFLKHQETIRLELVSMLRNIVKSFLRVLQDSNWVDENTKSKAIHVVSSIRACIMNLTTSETDFLENEKADFIGNDYIANMERFKAKSSTELANVPLICFDSNGVSSMEMDTRMRPFEATDVNAFYYNDINAILYTPALLSSNLFASERPNVLKFATTGFIFGHEIGHAIDQVNILEGSYGDKNWWKQGVVNQFTHSRACLVNQFSKYRVSGAEDIQVNGIKFILENVADLTGLQAAYTAYDEWLKENEENEKKIEIDGLDGFTPRQLFWLIAANLNCATTSIEATKDQLENGTHAPKELRVIGAFSNMEEFAKDFQCPVGSPMNPIDKCRIW